VATLDDFDLASLLRGEPGAWAAFVDASAPLLRGAIRRVLGGHGLADATADVLQEVYLKLCRQDARLLRGYRRERARLSTWLCVVAAHAALDEVRTRRRARATESAAVCAEAVAAPAPPFQLPPDLLSPRQLLVLRLLHERGLEVAEVARLLGIAEQSVRSLHHKALAKLREARTRLFG